MRTINIHDAKTNLSKYIAAAKKGQKIYIGGFGKPEVVLTSIPNYKSSVSKRNFTAGKNKITANPDAFTSATDDLISGLLLGDNSHS